jgi:predicted nucleotidyltransferase
MRIDETLRAQREEILRIAARHGARNLRVFGSVARGEDDDASDVDLLVDMEPGRTLFDLGGLNAELEALLMRRVDIVTARGLRSRIRDRVLLEARPL